MTTYYEYVQSSGCAGLHTADRRVTPSSACLYVSPTAPAHTHGKTDHGKIDAINFLLSWRARMTFGSHSDPFP